MNFKDLNRILKAEIFLHKDGQLRAAQVILRYTPSIKWFQSPKNLIRARDPRLALINVVVPRFLLTEPPSEGTQDAQLPILLAAKLIYSQEPTLPLDEEDEESTSEYVQEVTNKDFEAFYRSNSPSTSQAQTSTTVGFKEKTLDLLALLTAHVGGSSPVVAVVTWPLTPVATHTFPADAGDKKRKRA